jgi:hypothetical protein
VCNGQTTYLWDSAKKEIGVISMPPANEGQIGVDNSVSLLFGMKAADAKRRYNLDLLPQPNPKDPVIYYYIKVVPTQRADQAEFTEARLVLNAQTLLPRELYWESPNGNTMKWDFQKTALNPKLDPRDFGPPTPEPGWQMKIQPQQAAVKVLPRPGKVGEIKVLGNDKTPFQKILGELALYPGQDFDAKDLQAAEKRLAATGLFIVDPTKGIRPTVTPVIAIDGATDFMDLLIQVQEK